MVSLYSTFRTVLSTSQSCRQAIFGISGRTAERSDTMPVTSATYVLLESSRRLHLISIESNNTLADMTDLSGHRWYVLAFCLWPSLALSIPPRSLLVPWCTRDRCMRKYILQRVYVCTYVLQRTYIHVCVCVCVISSVFYNWGRLFFWHFDHSLCLFEQLIR